MKDKISIIIPAYNCEKYIKNTIESVLNQTYKNFELIIIDDGSTDNTKKICYEYSKIDQRIKVFSQKNLGVSSARNTGIKHLTGKYVVFLDADDYINRNTLKDNLEIMFLNNIDILKFNFIRENTRFKTINKFKSCCNKKISLKKYKKEKIYENIFSSSDFYNLWNTIFKKEIIINLKFDINKRYSEDYEFVVKALLNSSSIYFNNKVYYHYIVHNNSITQEKDIVSLKLKIDNICNTYLTLLNLVPIKNFIFDNLFELLKIDIIDFTRNYNYKNYKNKLIEIFKSQFYLKLKTLDVETFKKFEIKIIGYNFYLINKIKTNIKYIIKKLLK